MGTMEGGMLDRSLIEKARKEKLAAENAAIAQGPKEGVLDRSGLTEAKKEREAEATKIGEGAKDGVLDRTLIAKQRREADDAKAGELKRTIEERLGNIEGQGPDEQKPFSKEGLLNRNFGK